MTIAPIFSTSESRRLDSLESYDILGTLPESDYDAITQLASHICQTPVSSIGFLGEQSQWIKSIYGLKLGQSVPRESSFCTYTIQNTEEVMEVTDARLDERFCHNPAVVEEPHIIFYTGVPLVNQEGQALGTLCVVDYRARQLSDQQVTMLKALAQQVVTLLQLRRSQVQLEKAEQTLQTLNNHLHKRNQVLKTVVDTCPVRLVLLQAVRVEETIVDFRYDFSNPIDAALAGLTSEQMTGQSLKGLFPQVSHIDFFNRLVEVLQTGQAQHYQQQRNKLHHPPAWSDVTLTPCGDGVLYTSQDITHLKKTEEQLRIHTADLNKVVLERNAEINQLSALQQAILHYAGMAIISTDREGFVQTVNPSAERLLGYQAEELIGKKIPPILHYPHEVESQAQPSADQPECGVQTDFEFFKLLADNQTRECKVRVKGGKLIPVLLTRTRILDEAGAVMGFVGIATDITPQKEVELMLQKALQREQELNKLKSQFVATASHEFRTPLATIQSSVELIKLYVNSDQPFSDSQAAIQRHLAVIEKQIINYSDLLADVMTIGKIEAGRISYDPQQVDIVALADEVIDTHYSTRQDGRRVQMLVTGHERLLYLDARLIRHVLVNLLSNAFKFSTKDPELHITFESHQLLIQIIDEGIGIPATELPKLFDTFFRASNAANLPGSGLGLVIARQFVERHKGQLSIQSEENVGTTFTLTLPA